MHDSPAAPLRLRAVAMLVLYTAPGCAHMHHYQLGDIDSSSGSLSPFELRVDETGFDVEEAGAILRSVSDKRTSRRVETLENLYALFHVGPSTGDPTFSDNWAQGLTEALALRCPSGRTTGLTVIRESADYPVVSGEIVTIKGYCIQ